MKRVGINAGLFLALCAPAFVLSVGADRAEAACTCVCIEGRARAQCPSVLETPPVCPLNTCPVVPGIKNPSILIDPASRNCKIENVLNAESGKVERKRVCK